MNEEIDDILLVSQACMEISGHMLRLYRGKVENIIANNIAPVYHGVISSKNPNNTELLYALCFFDEFLDYCSENIFEKAAPQLLNIFINYCLTE